MMADEKQMSALYRRHEQLKRWKNSDTNLEPGSPKRENKKVKFQDGCVFLAACSSGDREEVKKLLERGADINTANVDGLTALHQACIDDNLEMVEFLVEMEADVDVCDNEGWTPLHATASCAFTEIARYLINHGANVAAVNNDGDLPVDIAENDEMENLLAEEMKKQGIDADSARREEEECMLEDANQLLRDQTKEDVRHPKTGATALHVAAAKGYLKVMNVLLEAGVDVNAEDLDGWTSLHAAAHWGQDEACKILVENMCDMNHKNNAGLTAFDLAEKDMLKLLEEMKEKQATLRTKHEIDTDIIMHSGPGQRRRSSVTRMSGDQKQNVIHRNTEEERAALVAHHPSKNTEEKLHNNLAGTAETISEENETERKNEKNKLVSQQPQPPSPAATITTSITSTTSSSWSRPSSIASSAPTAELRRPDMPKIDELSELERPSSVPVSLPAATVTTTTPAAEPPAPSSTTALSPPSSSTSTSSSSTTSSSSSSQPSSSSIDTSVLSPKPSVSISSSDKAADLNNDSSVQLQERLAARRPLSSTGSTTSATTTGTPTSSTETDSRPGDRSFAPPTRDEETETQRKARAKHARQTRRSTQGVSLEDIEKAEESLRSNEPAKVPKDSVDGPASSARSSSSIISSSSALDRDSNHVLSSTGGVPTASTATTTSSSVSSAVPSGDSSSSSSREDRSIMSGYRRRATEDKSDTSSADAPPTRSSYRRAREDRDLNSSSGLSSSDLTSNYIPRSQRNSALLSDPTSASSSSTSQGLLRSTSLRSSRLRNGDADIPPTTPRAEEKDDAKKDDSSSQGGKEEKKELTAVRARRNRRERRSTGIVYDNEGNEESVLGKDNKPEEDKQDDALGSSRFSSRYSSNSDVPSSDRSQRPVSYSEFSRSTGSLDLDYKKKYEDEKSENDRLRKELEETKKNLLEAKTELDKVMKQKDAVRNTDRDKRALERKLSEMEEELKKMEVLKADNQRLKDENGALIRVISKLSK